MYQDQKTAIRNALVAAGLMTAAGVASAAAYVPPPAPACMPGAVTVGCEAEAWDFGAELLWVQQASEANWYWSEHRRASVKEDGLFDLHWDSDVNYNSLKPRWAWGFRLEGSYHFGTGSDFTVNWTYFRRSQDRYANNGTSQYLPNAPIGFIGEADENGIRADLGAPGARVPGNWDNLKAWSKSTFNQVNFEFGQTVHYGEYVDVRFHAGLAYVNLRHDMSVAAHNNEAGNLPNGLTDPFWKLWSTETAMTSRFSGVGPRFGHRASYDFGNGFSVFGEYALSALIGNLKSSSHQKVYKPKNDFRILGPLPANNGNEDQRIRGYNSFSSGSQRAIVAGLETALGVNYEYVTASGSLNLYAAWRANIYQSIIQQGGVHPARPVGHFDGEVEIDDGELERVRVIARALKAGDTTRPQNHNWGYHGPVIGFKWIGNV